MDKKARISIHIHNYSLVIMKWLTMTLNYDITNTFSFKNSSIHPPILTNYIYI